MRNYLFILGLSFISLIGLAQNPGDTIVVETFNYNQTYGVNQWSPGIRDTIIDFPNDTSISYERVLMYYNIRCKNGLVSPAVSGQTDIGCGEWDISCNTYITDSSKTDSILSRTNSHVISNFSGTQFDYANRAMNDYLRFLQKHVVLDSTLADTQVVVGTGMASQAVLPGTGKEVKVQFVLAKSKLQQAGLSAGDVDAMVLHLSNGPANYRMFRVRMAHSSDSVLLENEFINSNYTEVFFHDITLDSGLNQVQFYTPFAWNGSDHILIEVSYSNKQSGPDISALIDAAYPGSAIYSADKQAFHFNGSNYAVATGYKGITGGANRTIEAWIKTGVTGKDIISWGSNNTAKKWIFRVNSTGGLRVEINGGYTIAATNLADNQWHHVAMVMNGSSLNNIQFYVDGNLETIASISNRTIDTDSLIDVVLSQGFHNRMWDGEMNEIRVWSSALSASSIQEWMHRRLDNSHPKYSDLELYYTFDASTGDSIIDHSGNQRHAVVYNNAFRYALPGKDLFSGFELQPVLPKVTLLQGTYMLTINTDTVLDTIQRAANSVKTYHIISNAGTQLSDLVSLLSDTLLWEAGNEYTLDPITGAVLDTHVVASAGSIQIQTLEYFRRYPMKFEIMSFVTPYGINLDLGPNGKTWTFDVTDFLPVLQGSKRMTVERGGQWMEDMDIRFAYIVGTPPHEVLDMQQIWRVDKKGYADILNNNSFEPRIIHKHKDGKLFKVRSSITGHGQEGEFISRNHHININGGNVEFSWPVWKKCSDNPIYPQGGTWIYSRAGWCPGAPTDLKEMDITPLIAAADSFEVDYSLQTASGSSNYIVNNQLVTYGDPNFQVDAMLMDVKAPSKKVEYARSNMICQMPEIVVKNTGAQTITSMEIHYWVNGNTTPKVHQWTGNLTFLEESSIVLAADSALWTGVVPGGNVFHAEVVKVNGQSDEYALNNSYHSPFDIPDVVPSDIIIFLYTNKAPNETSYRIYGEDMQLLYSRSGFAAQKLNRDTFHLGVGCYTLEVLDSDGDGLSFFANSDGNGFFSIRDINNGVLKTFDPDFGSKITYNFTVDFPLKYEEIHKSLEAQIYPNPSDGMFTIEFSRHGAEYIQVWDALGRLVKSEDITSQNKMFSLDLTQEQPGIYMVKVASAAGEKHFKVVVR
jgi:hypothetical protein